MLRPSRLPPPRYQLSTGYVPCPDDPASCACPDDWYPDLLKPTGAPLGPSGRRAEPRMNGVSECVELVDGAVAEQPAEAHDARLLRVGYGGQLRLHRAILLQLAEFGVRGRHARGERDAGGRGSGERGAHAQSAFGRGAAPSRAAERRISATAT